MQGIFKVLLGTSFLVVTGLGCQNSMYKENTDLRTQNLELQNQLDDAHRQSTAQVSVAAAPIPTAAIAPRQTELVVTPDKAPTPAPQPKPDFGGFEVTQDTVAGTTTVNLPSDVFFASGQAMLLPDAKASLAKVVATLKKQYARKPIRIEGHTDSDPIVKSHWKSNKELSEKRAEAVRDYLISKGIDQSRFNTEGLGDTQPKSKSDKAKNRRVDLVVMTR